MKIKDVCQKTGLTDRAIRFYIEKGLLQTQSQLVNGRISRDFSEEDVAILIDISKLRKAGFSISDIAKMQDADCNIPEIIDRHCRELEEEQQFQSGLISELREIEKRGNLPWRKIAEILFREHREPESIRFSWPEETLSTPARSDSGNRRRRFLYGIAACIVLVVLVFFSAYAAKKSMQSRRELVWGFTISDIVIEEKWYENTAYYATLHSTFESENTLYLEQYFEFSRTLPVSSGEVYESLLVDGPTYESANLTFCITYGEAEELGLLNEQGQLNPEKVADVILSDILSIKKYCSLTGIRAGGETHIYHYP